MSRKLAVENDGDAWNQPGPPVYFRASGSRMSLYVGWRRSLSGRARSWALVCEDVWCVVAVVAVGGRRLDSTLRINSGDVALGSPTALPAVTGPKIIVPASNIFFVVVSLQQQQQWQHSSSVCVDLITALKSRPEFAIAFFQLR